VVHLPGSLNFISQSLIMDKDVKVKLVNHYGLNLYNGYGKLIATAPPIDVQFLRDFMLDRDPGLSEYTDLDDSCLLALTMTGHASRDDAEKRMLWHHRLAHVSPKTMERLPTITAGPKLTGKSDFDCYINCKLARKPFTPNTTSHATEPMQLVHSDICGPLETAI
jgi:hypothetical protein